MRAVVFVFVDLSWSHGLCAKKPRRGTAIEKKMTGGRRRRERGAGREGGRDACGGRGASIVVVRHLKFRGRCEFLSSTHTKQKRNSMGGLLNEDVERAGSVGCWCGSSLLAEAVPRSNSRLDSVRSEHDHRLRHSVSDFRCGGTYNRAGAP